MNSLQAKDGREILIDLPVGKRTGTDGSYNIKCPFCPPRKPEHAKEEKLNINPKKFDNVTVFRCNHCGVEGIVVDEKYWRESKIETIGPAPIVSVIDNNVINWFNKVRKISKKTLDALHIYTEIVSVKQNKNPDEKLIGKYINQLCIAYPYIKNGNLINVKHRDPNKNFKLMTGATKIPYNIDSIKGYDYCIWVEGENDVCAYVEAGITPVVSPPNGATISKDEQEEYEATGKILRPGSLNMDWLVPVYNDFRNIEKHYIATDDDGPGYKLREEIAKRFGKDKCYLIRFKDLKYKISEDQDIYQYCKDPNDVLIHFGVEKLIELYNNATPYPVDDIITIPDVLTHLVDEFKHGKDKGLTTGYQTLDPYFTWKFGQTYVLNGYPGEGKTTLTLNLIVLSIMLHDFKWFIYSPENYPVSNIVDTLAEIIVGSSSDIDTKTRMSLSQYLAGIKKVLVNNVFFADREQGFTPEEFRDKSLEMVRKYGINAILIDPWRGLNHLHKGRTLDEYLEFQIGMENRFATTHNVIKLINHHPPTPDKKKEKVTAPSPYDLKGGEIWYARIYNILCTHRQDKFSFDNLKAEFWSQKIKENKLVGVVTPKDAPVVLNFERKSGRLKEYIGEGSSTKLKWPGEDIELIDNYKLF